MTHDLAFARLREANPVPEPLQLDVASTGQDALLASITERTARMQTQEQQQREIQPKRPNGWLVAAAAAAIVIVALGLINLVGETQEPVSTEPPTESLTNPITVADQWVDAMNNGDLQGALSLLSPETSCDLPTPTGDVESCEQHLGYLVAIGTHFEKSSCRESAPYRCNYDLTSQLHATLGYPDFSLPMPTVFTLDEDGLLVADFFGSIDTATSYYPTESGELWGVMRSMFPNMEIDITFGPRIYDHDAGVAAMEAARALNDPDKVVTQLSNILALYATSGITQCAAQDGSRDCTNLVDFLEGIHATLSLDCDTAAANDGQIPCEVTIDSAIHETLESDPSSGAMTITYRGGRAQAFSMDVLFAADPDVHSSFMDFARSQPGLFSENTDRAVWTAETGALWLTAAAEFVRGN